MYNPIMNPINWKKTDVLQMHTHFTKTTSNRYAGLQPGVNKHIICDMVKYGEMFYHHENMPL